MVMQKKHITGVSLAALAARNSIAAFLKSKKNWLLAGAVLIPLAASATGPSGIVFNVDVSRGAAQDPISGLGNVGNWHY